MFIKNIYIIYIAQENTTMFTIQGYQTECNCQHCGRLLKHGIVLSDGRIVGATCLDKKLTQPFIHNGKKYRLGTDYIVKAAKVIQRVDQAHWFNYGVSNPQFIPV